MSNKQRADDASPDAARTLPSAALLCLPVLAATTKPDQVLLTAEAPASTIDPQLSTFS